MVITFDKVIPLIFNAIIEVNDQLLPEQRILPSEETVIFGDNGKLDSMALVSLIVIIEKLIEEEFNINFSLVDDSFTIDDKIFKNVKTLAFFIENKINNI